MIHKTKEQEQEQELIPGELLYPRPHDQVITQGSAVMCWDDKCAGMINNWNWNAVYHLYDT